MNFRLIIAGIAGMLASLAVPLPRDEPVTRAVPKLSGPAPKRTAKPFAATGTRDWPLDAAFIARMSADECGEALDRLMRHCACALPDGETLDAAVALTLRLTQLSAAVNPERNPLQGRLPPSWLLQRVTGSLLQHSADLPAGWVSAIAQSAAGRDAMLSLTTELAVSSPDKAKALAAACPAPWRQALHAKVREGLAVRDPVAAAREAWESAAPLGDSGRRAEALRPASLSFEGPQPLSATPTDNRQEMLMISSRKGPVKEAVTALALYGEGGPDDQGQQRILANLLHRDSEATRAAVEESGDPVLQKLLTKAEKLPAEFDGASSTPADLAAALRKNPAKLDPRLRQKAWQSLAALDPDQATKLWRGMTGNRHTASSWAEAGSDVTTGKDIAAGMAAADPERAFNWAKADAPDALLPVFNTWLQADGPAALRAVWSLPADNRLRDQVERIVGMPGDASGSFNAHMSGVWMDTPVAEIRSAARYVKLPEAPPSPPTITPGPSAPGSSLWSDGPVLGK